MPGRAAPAPGHGVRNQESRGNWGHSFAVIPCSSRRTQPGSSGREPFRTGGRRPRDTPSSSESERPHGRCIPRGLLRVRRRRRRRQAPDDGPAPRNESRRAGRRPGPGPRPGQGQPQGREARQGQAATARTRWRPRSTLRRRAGRYGSSARTPPTSRSTASTGREGSTGFRSTR